jgi:hypothetical protein
MALRTEIVEALKSLNVKNPPWFFRLAPSFGLRSPAQVMPQACQEHDRVAQTPTAFAVAIRATMFTAFNCREISH